MTEINKYQNGKIYKIVCNKTNLVYIGSTTQNYLSDRLKGHRCNYKRFLNNNYNYVLSYKILENNDYYIELVELFPCNSKDELLVRERYYFDNIDCINKVRPKITKDEITEYIKKYYEENKEKLKEQKKIYNNEHKDKIREQQKIYNNEHKDKIKEQVKKYSKEYREINKDKIKDKKKEYREANKDKIKEQKKIDYLKKKELKNL